VPGQAGEPRENTALAPQLVEASDLLLAKANTLVAALRDLGLPTRTR